MRKPSVNRHFASPRAIDIDLQQVVPIGNQFSEQNTQILVSILRHFAIDGFDRPAVYIQIWLALI